eukprot:c23681_g3_i2 orf=218-1654(-)
MASNCEALHALAIPYPLQGHISPLIHLSYKLASSYNVSISFIVTEHLLSRLSPQSLLPIKLVGLSDNLPRDHARHSTFAGAYEAAMGLEVSTEAFLQDLAGQKQLPSFMIVDHFVVWAHRLALKHGIPTVVFSTDNVASLAVMSSVPKLIDLGILPLKTVSGSLKFVDELITCFPGIPPLHPSDMPLSLRSPSISHQRIQYAIARFAEASKAVAVLVNSISEIEKSVLEGLELKVPTFCIGPTVILNGENSALQGIGASLWPEQEDCLLWLDKQASASVLYVSFGSVTSLNKLQLEELAYGLEASEKPFLWVLRLGSFEESLSELLPYGFLERTKNRGYIVPWCPQLLVLSHYATGAFLTHCGWNSILENICLGGVPIICWPDAAEQALNARVIVDVWKVGLRVTEEDNGIVKRKEVERVVRAVMQDEGAKAFIREAAEVRDKAKRAVQEGGSSLQNIEKVLEIVANAKARETASVRQ